MKKIFSLIIATILFASFALINNNSLYASENANESVVINFEIFPDKNFQDYILHYIDIDNNGALEQNEIQNVQTIDISECEISDLTGILMFTNLKRLDCSYNKIKEFPQLPKSINELICSNNCLAGELDVSGYTNLYGLNCSNNNLTSVTLNDKCSYEYVILENNHIISESDVKGKNFEWCYIPGDRDVYTFWPQRIDEYLCFDGTSGTITYCEKSATNIVIPEKIKGIEVVAIGECAFADCKNLIDISMPSTLTVIGERAFENCTALSALDIEGNLESIGYRAFYNCDSLVYISLLLDDASIERGVFDDCDSLTEVNFSGTSKSFGNWSFRGCKSLQKVALPKGMKSLGAKTDADGYGFFQNCVSLASVMIPESVTLIGDNAFNGCTSLVSVNVPSGVSYIGRNAFHWCSSLESIVIPSGVSIINYGTFEGCSKLSTVFLPEGIIQVCDSAFEECESLESITLPSSLEIIEDFAFSDCEKIEEYVLGKNVTFIGDYVFQLNWNLNRIYVDPDNKYFSSVDGVLFDKNKSTLIKYPIAKQGKVYSVPESVMNISDYAFQFSELEQLHLPNKLQTIGNHAFQSTSLRSVKLPDTVTSIGIRAFNCWNLNRIYISANVGSIGKDAFINCESVTIYGESESYAESYALQNNIPFISGEMPAYKDIETCVIEELPDYEYTAEVIKPTIVIKDGDYVLKENVDYTVEGNGGKWPGSYTFYIDGIGNYYGSTRTKFSIIGPNLKYADTFSDDTYEYIFDRLGFAAAIHNGPFEESDPAETGIVKFWLETSQELKDYRNENYYIELPLSKYLELARKYFSYCDRERIINSNSTIKYVPETDMITILPTAAGGDITWELLEVEKTNERIKLRGLYCTNLANAENVPADKEEFYDYFLVLHGGKKVKANIARSIEFTLKKTEDGYKIASYKILPYYDYNGTRYYYNEVDCRFYPEEILNGSGGTESPTPAPAPTPCGHNWNAATCTAAKTCVLCGATEGTALGHSVGTAKVTKKATASKAGTKVQNCTRCNEVVNTITINPAKVSLSKDRFSYTGKVISSKKLPKIVVKDGNGKTIAAKYYTVKKPSNAKKMKAIGRYAYKITFKKTCKEYTGSKTVFLQITPNKNSVSSVKAGKKAVTVKWKKGTKAQVTGYQVMTATNSKFTKNAKTVTIKGYSKTSAKVSKLKAKTKYFVKVRTYKTVKGVKIYSDWSKVVQVKTK